MAKNLIYITDTLSVICDSPAAPVSGDPVRFGIQTGVALTDESGGGNPAGYTTVDFGLKVWDLPVTDHVGGGIAIGDTLFLIDGAPATVENDSSGRFFGVALEAVGAGLTATIQVLHVPGPGAGTLGAGTIATAHLAAGILSADVAGRGKIAANYFDEATVLAKFATDSVDNPELLKIVKNGAFLADANTRALFADYIWTEAKIALASLTGAVAAVVADANVIGGLPVLHRVNITAGALGDTDVVLTHKTRVLDAWLVLRGAGVALTTLQVKNGANAITDTMAASGADTAVVRCAQLDDANWEIAAGGTLRVTSAGGATQPDATVYVLGVRVA